MDKLDEKGFVFLDRNNRPYLCAIWERVPWLFYWHPDNHWVSLRRVSQSEMWGFPHNLTKEEQAIYWKRHNEYNQSLDLTAKDSSAGQLNP